jgi:hypothetical protein
MPFLKGAAVSNIVKLRASLLVRNTACLGFLLLVLGALPLLSWNVVSFSGTCTDDETDTESFCEVEGQCDDSSLAEAHAFADGDCGDGWGSFNTAQAGIYFADGNSGLNAIAYGYAGFLFQETVAVWVDVPCYLTGPISVDIAYYFDEVCGDYEGYGGYGGYRGLGVVF